MYEARNINLCANHAKMIVNLSGHAHAKRAHAPEHVYAQQHIFSLKYYNLSLKAYK